MSGELSGEPPVATVGSGTATAREGEVGLTVLNDLRFRLCVADIKQDVVGLVGSLDKQSGL